MQNNEVQKERKKCQINDMTCKFMYEKLKIDLLEELQHVHREIRDSQP